MENRGEVSSPPASVRALKENWQKWSDQHQEDQAHNPFSQASRPSSRAAPQRGQALYGRPPPGSLTERRGKEANAHISSEVQQLCEVIRDIGELQVVVKGERSDGRVVTVTFGKLLERYVTISDKLVGVLLRARKQRLVSFEGEMLWQRKDDHVVITLLL